VQKKDHNFTIIFGNENIFPPRKNSKLESVPGRAAQNSDTYRLDNKVVNIGY